MKKYVIPNIYIKKVKYNLLSGSVTVTAPDVESGMGDCNCGGCSCDLNDPCWMPGCEQCGS